MLEEGKASEEDANLILEGQEETELGQAPPARRHHIARVVVIVSSALVCMLLVISVAIVVRRSLNDAYDGPAVILISIDGFRWDYLHRGVSPNLQKLIDTGVTAPYMTPIFPSKTFPNHYTLVTGLYAETHGIMANTFYDPVLGFFRAFGCTECNLNGTWWEGGEPLWVTAAKQKVKSGAVFWPGSEAEIHGYRPTYYLAYNASMPYKQRVEQAMTWLKLPRGERPRFLTLYFDHVDSMGHQYGPDSPMVDEAITEVDDAIGSLVEQLRASGLHKDTSLIVVADHGMTADSPDRVIFIDDYISMSDITVVDSSPVLTLLPKVDPEIIYNALHGAHPNLTVYYKQDIPDEYHYKNNPRVTPIVAVADLGATYFAATLTTTPNTVMTIIEGWEITDHAYYNKVGPAGFSGGNHGFDPAYMDMKPIFIANGVAFKKGVEIPPLANTEIYNIICHILSLEPAPNNGTLDLEKEHWFA